MTDTLSNATFNLLALKTLPALTYATLQRLSQSTDLHAPLEKVLEECNALQKLLPHDAPFPLSEADALELRQSAVNHALMAARLGQRLISPLDSDFPTLLRSSPYCPPVLTVGGSAALSGKSFAALVGSAQPTAHGAEIARRLTRYLCLNGFTPVTTDDTGVAAAVIEEGLALRASPLMILKDSPDHLASHPQVGLIGDLINEDGSFISACLYGHLPTEQDSYFQHCLLSDISDFIIVVQSGRDSPCLMAAAAQLKKGGSVAVVCPTVYDTERYASRVEGNLILLGSNPEAKLRLLGLSHHYAPAVNDRLIVIRDKNAYPLLKRLRITRGRNSVAPPAGDASESEK